MKVLKSLIHNCDQLGLDIEFYVDGKKKSKSILGGILSIICFLVLMAAIWSMSYEMFIKMDPILDIEDVFLSPRPPKNYTSLNFPISFCLQDYNQSTFYEEKYFKFDVKSITTSTKNMISNYKILEYENCTFQHFSNFSEEYVNTSGILNYKCLKDKVFQLGGFWDEPSIQYLSISIRQCNNKTDNNTCAPEKEIHNWFRSRPIALNIYFGNNKVNHRNRNDPMYSTIDVLYKDIKLSVSKILNIFIRKQEVITDTGLIFSEMVKKESFTIDYFDYDEGEYNDETFMTIKLFASSRNLIYHRRYKKLQDLLANIGGLKNSLFLITQFIIYHYSKIKLNERIINKTYEFNPDRKKNSYAFNKIGREFKDFVKRTSLFANKNNLIIEGPINSDKKCNSDNFDLRNEKSYFKNGNCDIYKDIMNNESIKSEKYIKSTTFKIEKSVSKIKLEDKHMKNHYSLKKMNFSIFDVIKIKLCEKCLKRKLKFAYDEYRIAENDIMYHLDVRNLVRSMEEIKLLKFILFNYNQLVIFRYITSVRGTIDERRNISLILKEIKGYIRDKESFNSFIEDYKNQNKGNYSEIDERLFKFIS